MEGLKEIELNFNAATCPKVGGFSIPGIQSPETWRSVAEIPLFKRVCDPVIAAKPVLDSDRGAGIQVTEKPPDFLE